MSDPLDEALAALARAEGKSVEEMRRELVRDGLKTKLARREPEERGVQAPAADRYAGESPEEAQERWYASEAELHDGVHGFGGQTAGGIFGDGPIATEVYDPNATHRATARAASHIQTRVQVQTAEALGQLSNVVAALAERAGLVPQLGRPKRGLLRRRR